ncbi:LEM domain-containing protein 1 isoform X1 [Micropterus dolomieu]|uniref:LEM domain-containing protein 1 isoform X1 n=2 Tax=Micropterus dolomieu TaxID=147949 RepID=UPI001E8E504D|nr:LEM domain-containing protein 1 isoform X1 [Micropterus dolomieu]
MPLFKEDPAHLSKSRLKSDLVSHNVVLPPAKSTKDVYVELHLKHVDQKNAADFSSDEEDRVQVVADEDPEDSDMPDPSGLTDDELKAALLTHGVKAGPIVASTRALYEKKLRKLLQSDGHSCLNGAEKSILYSDSDEEEENGEGHEESGSEERVEQSDQAQQEGSQEDLYCQNGFVYPQCFLLSSRLRARTSRNREPSPKWNSGNVVKTSERSLPHSSQIPIGISRASSVDQRSGLGSGVASGSQSVMPSACSSFSSQAFSITQMVEQMDSRGSLSTSAHTERELNGSNVQQHWSRSNTLSPEPDIFKDMFPDTEATPIGIYVTRRRPIKGAAGRPIQYAYPDTPASPMTLERREVERCLVPIHIQILVFLIGACLLYIIYVCVDDNSFSQIVALLDGQNQELDGEEGLLLQAET